MLAGVETLVIDLRDVGVRYFTYPATVIGCIEAAAARGIDIVILDRPAPLTGRHIECGLLLAAHRSFVGVHTVPIRHGLTLGEFARLVAAECGLSAPSVVPAEGWRRALWHDQTGLPWRPASPNLRTLDAVLLYVGTCLIEGTNLSEGRGTEMPFALVGAPWIDPNALAQRLRERDLPVRRRRAPRRRPCRVTARRARPRAARGHDRTLRRPARVARCRIRRLAGDPAVRQTLLKRAPLGPVVARWRDDAREFAQRRARHLLYADDGLS